jgi:hypothetical protein
MKRTCLLALLFLSRVFADEAQTIATLKAKGAQVQEQNAAVHSVTVSDASAWTSTDYALLRQLPALKMLSFGRGFGDAGLESLGTLPTVEYLQTNLMDVSDAGMKGFTALPKLRTLKFFHPGKKLTGSGFTALASLPGLVSLTVAGSAEFDDAGMAAIAGLSQIKELRTWHTGATVAGVKHLLAMKNLTSLTLGQRLSYQPPACVNDEAVELVAQMTWLESLTLQEARLSIGALWQLAKLDKLKSLNLDGIEISTVDVEMLRKQLAKVPIKHTQPDTKYAKRIEALTPAR